MRPPGGRSRTLPSSSTCTPGPYEWLLALILKDELEIFEVPLRELVSLYVGRETPKRPNALERDTDFAGSAAALILLKSRTLSPPLEAEAEATRTKPSRPRSSPSGSSEYLKVRRAAEALRERFAANAGHYPSAHTLRPGKAACA